MGIFKRFAGLLGFGNQEVNRDSDNEHDVNQHSNSNSGEKLHHYSTSNLPRKGFSVPVQVPVDRVHQIGPILAPCAAGDGGVQGLQWYTQRLKIDDDGDVADEFLDEEFQKTSSNTTELRYGTPFKFQVKLKTKPANARTPCLSREGTVQHYVEFRGQWRLVG